MDDPKHMERGLQQYLTFTLPDGQVHKVQVKMDSFHLVYRFKKRAVCDHPLLGTACLWTVGLSR